MRCNKYAAESAMSIISCDWIFFGFVFVVSIWLRITVKLHQHPVMTIAPCWIPSIPQQHIGWQGVASHTLAWSLGLAAQSSATECCSWSLCRTHVIVDCAPRNEKGSEGWNGSPDTSCPNIVWYIIIYDHAPLNILNSLECFPMFSLGRSFHNMIMALSKSLNQEVSWRFYMLECCPQIDRFISCRNMIIISPARKLKNLEWFPEERKFQHMRSNEIIWDHMSRFLNSLYREMAAHWF